MPNAAAELQALQEMSWKKKLAEDFPEYAESLNQINTRIIDLIEPFRGRFIYSPKQQSSCSIKDVLPAFTNHNYQGMEIANGGETMDIYLNFLKGKIVDEDKMIADLLSYYRLDTYAIERVGESASKRFLSEFIKNS